MTAQAIDVTTEVLTQQQGSLGVITLNRPKALNALSLGMVRALTAALQAWRGNAAVQAVVVQGAPRVNAEGRASVHFCAGGDIRFFHTAALAGDPRLEDFFTEEYALNHLINTYPKPYISLLEGVCMGGGMGVAGHGATHSIRVASPSAKLAMPETNIGLFPDVGGGWFLPRCVDAFGPGLAEYLALTGQVLNGAQAVAVGLADHLLAAEHHAALVAELTSATDVPAALKRFVEQRGAVNLEHAPAEMVALQAKAARFFRAASVRHIVQALEACAADSTDADQSWAADAAKALRQRSPLMCEVTLEQLRRGRSMNLANDLRMERDLVRHSFHPMHLGRGPAQTDTVEGIRALAVDKDHAPRWNPARLEDVTPEMVSGFFVSPWPGHSHPLAAL